MYSLFGKNKISAHTRQTTHNFLLFKFKLLLFLEAIHYILINSSELSKDHPKYKSQCVKIQSTNAFLRMFNVCQINRSSNYNK